MHPTSVAAGLAKPLSVFVIDHAPCGPNAAEESLACRLDAADRARLASMTRGKRRGEFLRGRLLLAYALRRCYGEAGSGWRLSAPEGRPPALVCQGSGPPPPAVSIAHSAGLVVCAVADLPRLGVDVERCRTRRGSLDALAQAVSHPLERAESAKLDRAGRLRRFYECWTSKEALGKALGRGLDLVLRDYAFSSGRLLAYPAGWGEAGECWRFASLPVGRDGQMALAWTTRHVEETADIVVHCVGIEELAPGGP